MIIKSKQHKLRTFEKHFKPHIQHLYRLAFRLTSCKEDAEDLVQDLVIKIYNGSTDIASLENPKTWLSKVLYRLFVDNYRRKTRSPIIEIVSNEEDETMHVNNNVVALTSNPEQIVENQHFLQAIDNSLKIMGDEARTLIIMYEIEGYTLNEMHEILDIPIGTLKSRLHRARKKLRKLIDAGTKWNDTACSKQGHQK